MHGGKAHVRNILYVTRRLGSEGATPTEIAMGHDPILLRQAKKIKAEVSRLTALHEKYQALITKNEHLATQYAPTMEHTAGKLKIAIRILNYYKRQEEENTNFTRCRVIVPGVVMPGVRISIGDAVFWADQSYSNVSFSLEDDRVVVHPSTTPKP
jgi:hypothetical protein